jgi:hypothetical protein
VTRDYQSRGYIGGAPITSTISGSIGTGDSSFAFSAGGGTGFPTTNFWAILDPLNASAEKVLVGSRSGDNCTGVIRGVDGTTAKTHTNCSIIHCGAAQDFVEANAMAAALTTKGDSLWKGGTLSVAPARLAAGTDQQIVRYLAANSLGVETTFKGSIPIFSTTGARDAAIPSPSAGQACYVDDGTATEGLQFYNGTSWRPVSWNAAWGVVAQASSTSDQSGITTTTDITFTTSNNTWTGVAGRLYEIVMTIRPGQVTTAGTQEIFIQTGVSGAGTSLQDSISNGTVAAGNIGQTQHVAYHTGSGALSAHARATTTAGTMLIQNSSVKGWFVIKDIGPIGAPA